MRWNSLMNCVFPYENLHIKKKKIGRFSRKRFFSPDNLKISFLAIMLSVFTLAYIITVNISSTEWYYYDQVRKQQDKVNFTYNVVKLNNLTLQSELWNKINFNTPLMKDSVQYLEVRS